MPPLPSASPGYQFWIVERDQLDHRRVQLVLVALRRGAAFEVRNVRALVGDDQSALELAGLGRVDPEVRREFHRAAHAGRDVDERAVGEDGGVQCGEEVVVHRHHRPQVLAHQVGELAHRLRERAEDDPVLLQFLLEGGGDGDRVEDGVHRDTREPLLLVERDAELLVGASQFGVEFVEALELNLLLGRGVVADRLVVDRRVRDLRPVVRLHHLLPTREGFEPPLDHPRRLALLLRDEADHVLAEAGLDDVHLDVGGEAELVIAAGELLEGFIGH
jgi:hypothetical protein